MGAGRPKTTEDMLQRTVTLPVRYFQWMDSYSGISTNQHIRNALDKYLGRKKINQVWCPETGDRVYMEVCQGCQLRLSNKCPSWTEKVSKNVSKRQRYCNYDGLWVSLSACRDCPHLACLYNLRRIETFDGWTLLDALVRLFRPFYVR